MRRIAALALVAVLGGAGCVERADPDDTDVARAMDEMRTSPDEDGGDDDAGYGDDARLDSMQDDCEAGELLACDLLYLESPEGSEYEDVAVTCGGTAEDTGLFCTPYPEQDRSGYAPDDSEGLRDLAEQCKDGNLTACDVLYLLVRPGHELEDVAITCGGRAEEGVDVDCRSALG